MKQTIQDLDQIVQAYSKKIRSIQSLEFSAKPQPNKWSKKEVIGHLIDSAQNNLRRFICGQYESDPPKIVYDQNRWVTSNNYGEVDNEEIITLWELVNKRIIAVLRQMPPSAYERKCNTGKADPQLYTLEWLASDYVRHLKHHLNQVIPNSFDVSYVTY
ncbi:MAG TPA: DinB family protein [Cyclobacteriaceae bacterium]|nr:DinB family protein [Cyclobacteriaceae bacterium]